MVIFHSYVCLLEGSYGLSKCFFLPVFIHTYSYSSLFITSFAPQKNTHWQRITIPNKEQKKEQKHEPNYSFCIA